MSTLKNKFSIRITELDVEHDNKNNNNIYSKFSLLKLNNVPIIRLYGVTLYGQTVCLYIRNYYPYFYIKIPENITNDNDINDFIKKFLLSLKLTLIKHASVIDINGYETMIYNYEIVDKIDFYGYHDKKQKFLKIYMIKPGLIKLASSCLSQSLVLNQYFLSYESHVSYLLHFLIDYNLFGMDFIHLKKNSIQFRQPLPIHPNCIDIKHQYAINRIKEAKLLSLNYPSTSIKDTITNFNIKQYINNNNNDSSDDLMNSLDNTSLSSTLSLQQKYWLEDTIDITLKASRTITRKSCCDLEIDCTIDDIYYIYDDKKVVGSLSDIWTNEKNRLGLHDNINEIDLLDLNNKNRPIIQNSKKTQTLLNNFINNETDINLFMNCMKSSQIMDDDDDDHNITLFSSLEESQSADDHKIFDNFSDSDVELEMTQAFYGKDDDDENIDENYSFINILDPSEIEEEKIDEEEEKKKKKKKLADNDNIKHSQVVIHQHNHKKLKISKKPKPLRIINYRYRNKKLQYYIEFERYDSNYKTIEAKWIPAIKFLEKNNTKPLINQFLINLDAKSKDEYDLLLNKYQKEDELMALNHALSQQLKEEQSEQLEHQEAEEEQKPEEEEVKCTKLSSVYNLSNSNPNNSSLSSTLSINNNPITSSSSLSLSSNTLNQTLVNTIWHEIDTNCYQYSLTAPIIDLTLNNYSITNQYCYFDQLNDYIYALKNKPTYISSKYFPNHPFNLQLLSKYSFTLFINSSTITSNHHQQQQFNNSQKN